MTAATAGASFDGRRRYRGVAPSRVAALAAEVAADFLCMPEDVIGRQRSLELVRARSWLFIRLSADGFGLSAIGRRLGVDHATVWYHVKRRDSFFEPLPADEADELRLFTEEHHWRRYRTIKSTRDVADVRRSPLGRLIARGLVVSTLPRTKRITRELPYIAVFKLTEPGRTMFARNT